MKDKQLNHSRRNLAIKALCGVALVGVGFYLGKHFELNEIISFAEGAPEGGWAWYDIEDIFGNYNTTLHVKVTNGK